MPAARKTRRTSMPRDDDRLDFRLHSEAMKMIEQGAAVSGQTVKQFAVSTLVQSAEEILERRRMNPRHLSSIKSSELQNRYYNELGAAKLACLWVLEHIKK